MALALVLAGGACAEDRVVYSSDFDRGVGRNHWSDTRSFAVPDDGSRLLGPFAGPEAAVLKLDDLPEHSLVRLRCKLYALDTVDGSFANEPDPWSVGVVGGPCLLNTSFDNRWSILQLADTRADERRAQAFPDEFPAARHPGRTGADERKAFGLAGKALMTPASFAVGYHLDLVFPHEGANLGLRFGGTFIGKRDESWALGDVEVTLVDAADSDDALLKKHWMALHGHDPELANRALWDILACGEAGVKFAVERQSKLVEERVAMEKARRDRLAEDFAAAVEGLASEEFAERIKAAAAIIKMGVIAMPLIEEELESNEDPGVRDLLESVQKRFRNGDPKAKEAELQAMARSRVKHLLRVAGTLQSRQVLMEMIAVDHAAGLPPKPVRLSAAEAKRSGSVFWGFEQDPDRECWKGWTFVESSLVWSVPKVVAGEYEVLAELATGDGVGGDAFEVLVGGQVLNGTVPESKKREGMDEEPFQSVVLGKVVFETGGEQCLFVRPLRLKGKYLMELKGIELKPVRAGG